MTEILLTVLSTVLSTGACVIAYRALRTRRFPLRKLHDLELECSELRHEVDSLTDKFKRLNARTNMRAAREALASQKAEEKPEADHSHVSLSQQPGETSTEWKARVRRQMAAARVTNGG